MMEVSTCFLLLVLGTGCISSRSVSGEPEFAHLLGIHLQTTGAMFLVKAGDVYGFEDEWRYSLRPSLEHRAPTFAEFRDGRYKHRWQSSSEYLAILPAGTRFETINVV
jgi:hypothetical protein